jgi:hypothetical protein
MMKQGTRDNEIIGTLFYYILKDVDFPDLKTRQLRIYDTTEIDVARDYVTSGRHAFSQNLRDRSVTTADFQTAPA